MASGGKTSTFRKVANDTVATGKANDLAELRQLAAQGRPLDPLPLAGVRVRLMVDGAQTLYSMPSALGAKWARSHFTQSKKNKGQLRATDVTTSISALEEGLKVDELLRRVVEATEHNIYLELLPGAARFPKYRPSLKPSHGDLGRAFSVLERHPQRVTDGRRSRTISDEALMRSFRGFKDPSSTFAELVQHCVGNSAVTTVFQVVHGDVFFFESNYDGVQVVRSTDSDARLSLAFSEAPVLGRFLVVTNFNGETTEWSVADALFTHDAVCRHFLPLFVQKVGPPSLAFSKSLSQHSAHAEQRLWLAGLFVISQGAIFFFFLPFCLLNEDYRRRD